MQLTKTLIAACTAAAFVASSAYAQVPRGSTVEPSETSNEACSKVIERALAISSVAREVSSARPVIQAVSITGAERTSPELIVERSGLEKGQPLTTSALRRAARRTIDLPVSSCAWATYSPQDNGRTTVQIGLRERPVVPKDWEDWGEIGARALFLREIEIPVAGLAGYGERLDFEYGWKRERPRWAVRLTTPAPGVLPGLAVAELAWTRQAFMMPDGAGTQVIRPERHSFRVGLEDWAIDRLHWHVDGAYDRFQQQSFVALGAGVDTRWFGDRVAVRLESSTWMSTNDSPGFRTGSVSAHWRERAAAIPVGWYAEAGVTGTSEDAPVLLWPKADVGSSREAFLRGHRVLTSGVVTGEAFGRRLVFGSLNYERHLKQTKFGTVGLVGFVDTARAFDGLMAARPRAHVDIGVGARVHGSPFGSVRLDLGYGLRDGNFEVSMGFVKPWPRR